MNIENILIVEDELEIRTILYTYLNNIGYKIFEAEEGNQALKKITEESIDLIFLDIKLPGIDGIEVLQKLQELKPEIPVIILSGHGTEEIANQAISYGAFDYIGKPVDLEKIAEVISCVDLMS